MLLVEFIATWIITGIMAFTIAIVRCKMVDDYMVSFVLDHEIAR